MPARAQANRWPFASAEVKFTIRKGDHVEVLYTEALAISVKPGMNR
jgi:hypothetical protein